MCHCKPLQGVPLSSELDLDLDYCPHMDLPASYSGCTLCSGKEETTRAYYWQEPEVILISTRGSVSGLCPTVWKPRAGGKLPTARLLHICGNWRKSDFLKAVKSDVVCIEFAPSQRSFISKAIIREAKRNGVGIQLRALRGPKS